jgi:acetylornithine deacetylase
MEAVQREVEAALSSAAESDPWLSQHPPRLEWLYGSPGVEVPLAHPLYQIASGAIQSVAGYAPHVNPLHSASDIRNPMLQAGMPTIGLGSLAGNLITNGHHDEWVDVEDYVRMIQVVAIIVRDWCAEHKSEAV